MRWFPSEFGISSDYYSAENEGFLECSEFLASSFSDAPLVSAVPPRVSCLAGYRVALTCSVLSVPKPDVQWFFNRRQLKMDAKHTMEERGDNYTLTVADVRQQDLGEYTCSAVNKIGEAQASVLLTGTIQFWRRTFLISKQGSSWVFPNWVWHKVGRTHLALQIAWVY